MSPDIEKIVREAIALYPRSKRKAALQANIPYTTFVRYLKALALNDQKGELEERIKRAVNQNPGSMMSAAKTAGIPYATFIRHAKRLKIYNPNPAGRGMRKFRPTQERETPLKEILAGLHPNYPGKELKKRLLKAGLLKNKCDLCGLEGEWQGQPIVMAMDHKDGDNTNHRLENIRMLCPNCHSQSETYCGRNVDPGASSSVADEEFIEALRAATTIHEALKALGKPGSETWYKRARQLIETQNIEHLKPCSRTVKKRNAKYGSQEDYHQARRSQYIIEQLPYVDKVLTSGIDFSKFGWVTQVAAIINQKPQKVHEWMQTLMPEFYKAKCFKRKPADQSEE